MGFKFKIFLFIIKIYIMKYLLLSWFWFQFKYFCVLQAQALMKGSRLDFRVLFFGSPHPVWKLFSFMFY